MSAFIVGHDHIHAIVHAGLQYGEHYSPVRWATKDDRPASLENGLEPSPWGIYRKLTINSASVVGQILLDQNIRSVDHRYSESNDPELYQYATPRVEYEAVEILKAISCLDYQSCESDDWTETEAFAILQSIKNSAIHHLPGYEDAAWEIRELERRA